MNEAQVDDWFGRIDDLIAKLLTRTAGAADVERLAAEIIAFVRTEEGDTLWLDHAISGVGAGLIWHQNAAASGGETLVGLRLALSSAAQALFPLECVDPALRANAPEIDKRLSAFQEQGIFLTV